MPTILPVYVIYNSGLITDRVAANIEPYLIEALRKITAVDGGRASSVRLNFMCAGFALETLLEPSEFVNTVSNRPEAFRVDLRPILDRVLKSYEALRQPQNDLLPPELLIFLSRELFGNNWTEPLKKLRDDYRASVYLYWLNSNRALSEETRARIGKEILAAVAPGRGLIVDPSDSTDLLDAYLSERVAELQRRIDARLVAHSKTQAVASVKGQPPSTAGVVGSNPQPPPKPRETAKWEVREPAKELEDRPAHFHTESIKELGWHLVGASRRGRLHEHEATFREDEFSCGTAAGWFLIAVADGAGSHRLSRVGSKLAANAAIDKMRLTLNNEAPGQSVARVALQDGIGAAYDGLLAEVTRRPGVRFSDLSTTLLLLAYHPKKNLLCIAQIGDGLIAALLEDGRAVALANPESGGYSGETYFLTSYKREESILKGMFVEPKTPIRMLCVMTDGVSDDLYPPIERVAGLAEPIRRIVTDSRPADALLDLINYDRPGSFDDRTLVVLCREEPTKNGEDAVVQVAAVVASPATQSAPSATQSLESSAELGKRGLGVAAGPTIAANELPVEVDQPKSKVTAPRADETSLAPPEQAQSSASTDLADPSSPKVSRSA